MTSHVRDIGAFIKGMNALVASGTITAGTTADGLERDGYELDRNSLGDRNQSVKLVIPVIATLATLETVTVAANMQWSATTGSTTFTDLAGSTGVSTILGGSTGAQAINDVVELDAQINRADRYLRCQVTATLSATATDTATVAAVIMFGGADTIPVT